VNGFPVWQRRWLPLEVMRPLMGPVSGAGRAGGMDGADSAVDQRLDRSIRVVSAARIVRSAS
jgi:hypothetical protein